MALVVGLSCTGPREEPGEPSRGHGGVLQPVAVPPSPVAPTTPPPLGPTTLACEDLPADAFLDDAYRALLGGDPQGVTVEARDDALFEAEGLGTVAPGVADLDAAVRDGTLDTTTWPSLGGLTPADAELTIAVGLITVDPDFPVRCEYLHTFTEGPARSVAALALLVNASHGRPIPDGDVLAQPFVRKGLMWEIASARDRILGLQPVGGPDGVTATPSTLIVSPLIQLLAAFRGAHRAFADVWGEDRCEDGAPETVKGSSHGRPGQDGHSHCSGGRAKRPWAYRPFGHPEAPFDLLLALLGEPPDAYGIVGPDGGTITGSGALPGFSLEIPAGALPGAVAITASATSRAPGQTSARVAVGPAVQIIPDGLQFLQPATLTLPFHPSLVRALLATRTTVRLTTFDPGSNKWTMLQAQANPSAVTGEVAHLSLYQAALDAPQDLEVATLAGSDPPGAYATAPAASDPFQAFFVSGHVDDRNVYLDTSINGTDVSSTLVTDPEVVPTGVLAPGGQPGQDPVIYGGEVTNPDGSIEGRVVIWAPAATGNYLLANRQVLAGGGATLVSQSGTVPGAQARVGPVVGLAQDSAGNLYVAEFSSGDNPFFINSRILKIAPGPDHLVSVVAGMANAGFNGEGPASGTALQLNFDEGVGPSAVQMDGQVLFVADTGNNRVRALDVSDKAVDLGPVHLEPGQMATVMGTGATPANSGQLGDEVFRCKVVGSSGGSGGSALAVHLFAPTSVVVAKLPTGEELLVADQCNNRILVSPLSDPSLPVTVLAGTGAGGAPTDGQASKATLPRPTGLSFGAAREVAYLGRFLGRPAAMRTIVLHDRDRDGVGDSVDNCPDIANPDQAIVPGASLGEACDLADEDGDGLSTEVEYMLKTDPTNKDSNGDGYSDGAEYAAGLDPSAAGGGDMNGDGISDASEIAAACPNSPTGTICPAGRLAALDHLRQKVALWHVSYSFAFHYKWNDQQGDVDDLRGLLGGSWGMFRALPKASDGTYSRCFSGSVTSCEDANSPTATDPAPCAAASMVSIQDRQDLEALRWFNGPGTCKRQGESNCSVEIGLADRGAYVPLQASGSTKIVLGPPLQGYYDKTSDAYEIELHGSSLLAKGGVLPPPPPPVPPPPKLAMVTFVTPSGSDQEPWVGYLGLAEPRGDSPVGGALLGCASPSIGGVQLPPVPVLAQVPRSFLDRGKTFVVPVVATQANQDCSGSATSPNAGTLSLVGGLVFEPIAVAHPEDIEERTHRTADSQFVYGTGSPGKLAIQYTLGVPADATGVASYLTDQTAPHLHWTTPAIGSPADCGATTYTAGDVNVCWGPGDQAPATPRMDATSLTPIVTYEHLPKLNSDFGCKTVTVKAQDSVDGSWDTIGAVGYEVFFPRNGRNHPAKDHKWPGGYGSPTGPSLSEPNWLYYWAQAVPVAPGTALSSQLYYYHSGSNLKPGIGVGESPEITRWGTYSGPPSAVVFWDSDSEPIPDQSPGTPDSPMVRTGFVGIRYLASMALHEHTHAQQVSCFNECGTVAGKPFLDPNPLAQATGTGWSFNKAQTDQAWNHFWDDASTGQTAIEDRDGDDMCDQALTGSSVYTTNFCEDPNHPATACGVSPPGSLGSRVSLCDFLPNNAAPLGYPRWRQSHG